MRYYSLGSEGPLRASSVSYIIFFLLTFFICLYGCAKYYGKRDRPGKRNRKHVFLAVIMYCCLAAVINFELVAGEIKSLKNHYTYYQAVYPQLISGNPEDKILVAPEPKVSILRWTCYLTDDGEYWTNRAVARGFKVSSVEAEGGGAPERKCGGYESYKGNQSK